MYYKLSSPSGKLSGALFLMNPNRSLNDFYISGISPHAPLCSSIAAHYTKEPPGFIVRRARRPHPLCGATAYARTTSQGCDSFTHQPQISRPRRCHLLEARWYVSGSRFSSQGQGSASTKANVAGRTGSPAASTAQGGFRMGRCTRAVCCIPANPRPLLHRVVDGGGCRTRTMPARELV